MTYWIIFGKYTTEVLECKTDADLLEWVNNNHDYYSGYQILRGEEIKLKPIEFVKAWEIPK